MMERIRTFVCCVVLLSITLAGCESKPAAPPPAPKPRISAVEVFNLRTKCQELTEKWQEEGVLGFTGAALTSEVESHYDPVTNHCYAKVTVTKFFSYVDTRPAKDQVPNDYLVESLYDLQIKKQLLGATQKNGLKSGYDFRKDADFSVSFDAAKAEVDRLMSEE